MFLFLPHQNTREWRIEIMHFQDLKSDFKYLVVSVYFLKEEKERDNGRWDLVVRRKNQR